MNKKFSLSAVVAGVRYYRSFDNDNILKLDTESYNFWSTDECNKVPLSFEYCSWLVNILTRNDLVEEIVITPYEK